MNELFDLSGKVAIVTGGSRGLGLEIATGLGEAGASLVISARRDSWLKTATSELQDKGFECLPVICNVADPNDVATAVAAALSRFGRIDVLVNNAGMSWGASIEEMPLEKWRDVMDTNVTGAFLMTQAVGREMIQAGRGGAIINVASIAGVVGSPPEILDAIGYSASKGALISFTKDLAVKWARHGIRVNAIAPGYFETRMTTGVLDRSRSLIEAATPMGRIGQSGELRGVALFLASAASSYVTGQIIAVDGGATAW